MASDFLKEIVATSIVSDPDFPRKVEAAYDRRVFARRLAEIRKQNKLSQVTVAKRMKSTQPEVSKIESGGDVRVSTLERYAAAIGHTLVLAVGQPPRAAKRAGKRTGTTARR